MSTDSAPKPCQEGADFSHRVVAWWQQHGRRELPWQQSITPYRVWVSEIMLQQTRVTTVVRYFDRFIERFPTLKALAAANEDEVLRNWEGLGYYARARNLHRAARMAQEQHKGELPEELALLIALPGIGRSTAGAILSLALGRSYPILDGNVKRILARCFTVEGWPGHSRVEQQLWQLSEGLTPLHRTGDYNQGMMDLGSEVCTRSQPFCDRCPLSECCGAHQQGDPTRYPTPKPRRVLPVKKVQMVMITDPRGQVWLEKRPNSGVWGGLWCFPVCPDGQQPIDWCGEQVRSIPEEISGIQRLQHTFSHYRLEIELHQIALPSSVQPIDPTRQVWYNPQDPLMIGIAAPVIRMVKSAGRTD